VRIVRDAPIEVNHNAKLIVCAVLRTEEDNVTYAIYLKDTANLSKAIGFDLTVTPDGRIISIFQGSDPEELLKLLYDSAKWKSLKKKRR
jgi:hypothetical protein